MKKTMKISLILLIVAVLFFATAIIINVYFPDLIMYSEQSWGEDGNGGNLRLYVEPSIKTN